MTDPDRQLEVDLARNNTAIERCLQQYCRCGCGQRLVDVTFHERGPIASPLAAKLLALFRKD